MDILKPFLSSPIYYRVKGILLHSYRINVGGTFIDVLSLCR